MARPLTIVPQTYPVQRLCEESLSIDFLYSNVLLSEEACLRWLATYGLVLNERTCDFCERPMCFLMQRMKWRCVVCFRDVGARKGSFFEKNRLLSLTTVVKLLYWWTKNDCQETVSKEVGVSRMTVIGVFGFCRSVCVRVMEAHPPDLGGPGKVVEVDESVFASRKYNRGRMLQTQWVLGGIERGSGDCFLVVVPDRTADTLLPIIADHVSPETRIITDGWASYRQLPNHAAVNHSLHFVDPNDRLVHTNTVERLWRSAKEFLRLRRARGEPEALQANLHEFLWRRHHKNRLLGNLLFWIAFYNQ